MLVRRAVTAGISTLFLVACSGTTSSAGGDGGTASGGGSIHIDLSDLSDACAASTDCTASRIVDACGANCACLVIKRSLTERDAEFALLGKQAVIEHLAQVPTRLLPAFVAANFSPVPDSKGKALAGWGGGYDYYQLSAAPD